MQRSAFCRSRRELSNEYLLAKFGFDTAENEPLKVRITDHTFDHIPSVLYCLSRVGDVFEKKLGIAKDTIE